MALVNKPDESIFASSAKQGEVDNFPDLLRGWGITFDQTQGIPPMEWFNFLFKRLDEKHTYLMQRGLPEWSATQDYTKGSCVQFDGVSYRALKNSKNNRPNESNSQYWVRWGFTLSEIARATLTQYGVTQLYTGYYSQREDLALTPKTAYQLKQLIDSNTRSLGNVIPNSKKSSRVDSNGADTVATSAAVKTAYDKGVEAKTAADNANNNANNRVPFSQVGRNYAKVITNHDGYGGYEVENNILKYTFRFESENDHMKFWSNVGGNSYAIHFPARRNGEVALVEDVNKKVSKDGDEVKWLGVKRDNAWINITSTGSVSAGLDFAVQNSKFPQVSLQAFDIGGFGDELRIYTTPKGSNYDSDRRNHVMTVAHDGNVWVKPYGWLHDHFAKQVDINNVWNELNNTYRKNRFRHQHYPNHYQGAEVYDIPMADNGVMRVIVMNVHINGYAKVNLPEAYNGRCMVQATDVGGGRKTVGANIQNGNVVEIHVAGDVGLNILTIGWYGW